MPSADPTAVNRFEPGSFRDEESRVVLNASRVLRVLSPRAKSDFDVVSAKAFFGRAMAEGRLIATQSVPLQVSSSEGLEGAWAACVEHERIPFVSYPYEWCFSMLREAAELTLSLLQESLAEDVTMKDGTPYNVQWRGGRGTFIDTGSFAPWESDPWVGYQQFCQLFLYPLMLQAYKNVPFQPWLRGAIDGIVPEEFARLLSFRDLFRPGCFVHGWLLARAKAGFSGTGAPRSNDLERLGFNKAIVQTGIRKLRHLVSGLSWRESTSQWSDYASNNSYNDADRQTKERFVAAAIGARPRRLVWDIGCNTGTFARIAAEKADYVVALDADHLAIERLFLSLRREGHTRVLPLVSNVANDCGGIGFRGVERQALADRGQPDVVLALALVHHLAFSANISLADQLQWFAHLAGELVIEFVDRSDPMSQILLRNATRRHADYTQDTFESLLRRHFSEVTKQPLECGTRWLYHALRGSS